MAIVLPHPTAPLTLDGRPIHPDWYRVFALFANQFNALTGSSDSGITALDTRLDALEVLTTQGDIIVKGASVPQRLALGAAGTVLKSVAGDLAYGVGGIGAIVAHGAVSAAATLDIALSATYDLYEIELISFVPVTDNQTFHLRFSQSGVFLAGASDYQWGIQSAGVAAVDEADAAITLSSTIGNVAGEYVTTKVSIYRPSAAAFLKSMLFETTGRTGTPVSFATSGGGSLLLNTDAIDGARFFFASGNIASGYYIVRGYSLT